MTSSAVLEAAFAPVAVQIAAQTALAAGDATALIRLVAGLSDGNYYGRYQKAPIAGYLPAATSLAALTAQAIAWRNLIAAFNADALADAGNLGNFIADLIELPEAVRRSCADPGEAIRLLSALAQFAPAVMVAGSDAEGAGITALATAAGRLFRQASAVALARASADYVPSSQQDAATVRDNIAGILDDRALEAADAFDDASFAALDALRVAVVNDLTLRGASLAPIVTRSFAAPLPAAVIAYRLYQDATRADELVARNMPPHPAFMPRRIEALAN